MRKLGYALVGVMMFALSPTFAKAFEENEMVNLTEQIKKLQAAERSSRKTAEEITALNAAYVELHVDDPKALEALLTAAGAAHDSAKADLDQARTQRELADLALRQRLGEIKVEGAEGVEIGGEVRAARMALAAWDRIVETATQNLAQVGREMARIEAERCVGPCEPSEIAGEIGD